MRGLSDVAKGRTDVDVEFDSAVAVVAVVVFASGCGASDFAVLELLSPSVPVAVCLGGGDEMGGDGEADGLSSRLTMANL